MEERQLQSGIWLAEEEQVPPPAVQNQCELCGRPGPLTYLGGGWLNGEFWYLAKPSCGHESPLLCPACRDFYWLFGCRICGHMEEWI